MAETRSLPVLDRARCTGCGDCVSVCTAGVLALAGGRLEFVKAAACDYCGKCEATCAQGAISCPYDIVLDPSDQGRVPPPGG